MLGAILGDIIGSPYEFDPIKTKDFPLFSEKSGITDDSVMTVAVARGLLEGRREPRATYYEITEAMRELGRQFPYASYGRRFQYWLEAEKPEPYGSYGNGSAMRVSPVAWFFDELEDVEKFAALSAAMTHNHPEGIKGAQAVAGAIFLARTGASKDDIRNYVTGVHGYDLNRSLDDIRPGYRFDETCQGSVPEAIIAFMESTGFEDAIRNAISLGGDADTQAAIAGGIAEAYYGISEELKQTALSCLAKEKLGLRSWFDEVPKVLSTAWKHEPMSEKKAPLGYHASFTKGEYLRMSRGWLPYEMEDKWFIYEDGGWLNFHRSWTGICIYRVHLVETDGHYEVDESWVSRDDSQYAGDDLQCALENLHVLVNCFLLGKDYDAPSDTDPFSRWSNFGRGMFRGLSRGDLAGIYEQIADEK